MPDHNPAWVILKFGGSSVSHAGNWHNILRVLRERIAAGMRPVLVHSALSGVTDRLEALLPAAIAGEHAAVLGAIGQLHLDLAEALSISPGSRYDAFFQELAQIAAALNHTGRLNDATRARVMAMGELLATALGAAFLNSQGMAAAWIDARQVLRAGRRENATAQAEFLSATCDFSPDDPLQTSWRDLAGVIVTQGFIAANDDGATVLLGRGGSDTSGAYFAAKLAAVRLEIWTNVPGMFSANPRDIPGARLLRALHYDEALEIASSGAKLLHPRCILPLRQYGIPLHIYATQAPGLEGTVISAELAHSAAHVKSIAIKKGITLISMEGPGMWHQVGFLADAFQLFKQQGLSVDLISTSETNVTVTLDPAANALDQAAIARLVAALSPLCGVQVLGPCASVSLLGSNLRDILHELGGAFELFRDCNIHLVSQAANDLNFAFVIDESQGDQLVRQLHERLIQRIGADQVLGPTWQALFAAPQAAPPPPRQWWREQRKRAQLLDIAAREAAAYVYDLDEVDAALASLRQVRSVDRWAYAMKANWHPQILERLYAAGLTLECVSQGELEHVFASVPGLSPERVLFTPNFAPRGEYRFGFDKGVRVTLDNLHPLSVWPELFAGRDIFVRIDPGVGRGHHHHVRTAGAHAKFGVPVSDLGELERLVRQSGVRVVGLHAHTGSGIFEVANWTETGMLLGDLAKRFPAVSVVDLGGGLGVPDRQKDAGVDLAALERGVASLKKQFSNIEFWMEPGRFLVARAGVLVAQVTQLKGKGDIRFVGIATGMNSLIRPALYGAHHDVVNLTRLDQPATELVNVVGPICETADVLATDRRLPQTQEGDVLLFDTCGAYGYVMGSNYNRRAPAREVCIEP